MANDTSLSLFSPYRLGGLALPNRIVMAPLTRNRAAPGNVPTPLMAQYYAQRSSAGLIIAEATQVSATAQGYQDTPGIHTPAQIAGWRGVTEAVHAKEGRIFLQIWHVGRVSHRSLQPGNAEPLAPSAIRANTKTYVNDGFFDVDAPRALDIAEIPGIVADFRQAAANAIAAGFDGVEVHGANGYLIDQFLRDGANQRSDAYGGSVENRVRFLSEVMQAVIAEIGPERAGIRISPVTPANGISDSDPQPLFNHVVEVLDRLAPVYVHIIEGATGGPRDIAPDFDFGALRERFHGTWIANNGYDLVQAESAIASHRADLIAFGRNYVSNPDLVERLWQGAPLNPIDQDRLYGYGNGARGYTDYPALSAA
ncbi:alkene reductase [Pollutimonas bauzanensis]|uniref:N-ethylmaleimide reductase n=1 Tax=Pollutimonas bauzanensis TaxID=658167 RepID=A0A1M5MNN3_9BURK|nr:alkene reductase [Pollutimonas bauzanensis]SHG78918.1 N-ethylmaleimide reductase [Pollutimonas bauzanensis]